MYRIVQVIVAEDGEVIRRERVNDHAFLGLVAAWRHAGRWRQNHRDCVFIVVSDVPIEDFQRPPVAA